MGQLYKDVGQHLTGQFPGEIVLEIGSDRYEGSSYYFADLAITHGMRFVTVDLDHEATARSRNNTPAEWLEHCEFICAEAGEWTRNFHQRNQKIRVLYLDNFDWDWCITSHSDMIEQQKKWYATRGITMSNINCQSAHIGQMVNLLPYMADKSVICLDDTYILDQGVYIGKGGAVVPYLLSQGFGILQSRDFGVILGRGYKNTIV